MSFLDNLENNLKALESREEKDPAAIQREQAERAAERAAAVRRAPFEEALRTGPFAGALIAACRKAGHSRRVMVRPTWIESVLRLEARIQDADRRLELQPTGEGVRAVFYEAGEERHSETVDLAQADAAALAERWLAAGASS